MSQGSAEASTSKAAVLDAAPALAARTSKKSVEISLLSSN